MTVVKKEKTCYSLHNNASGNSSMCKEDNEGYENGVCFCGFGSVGKVQLFFMKQ